MDEKHNVNVTLGAAGSFAGKTFPCPLCGEILKLKVASTGKPYCHCDPCGVQLFVRRSEGIARLQKLLAKNVLTAGSGKGTTLYNRLSQLKRQRTELEGKQGLFFRDSDLDQAIAKIDSEITTVREALSKL